ncbi:hypothetical protein [Streptomyces sp. Inha503]|uniref:hypothetical protein n=1 Tax=Streptomyces sp. Inha503 TaxID=3383314 RepID=UPI0039A0CF51
MSTPPEPPSLRSIAREVAGLLLVAAGVLVVLVTLGGVHPLLTASAAAASIFAVFRFLAPPRTNASRAITGVISTIVPASAIGCAFTYYPFLGWVEVGAALSTAGMWLASEGD